MHCHEAGPDKAGTVLQAVLNVSIAMEETLQGEATATFNTLQRFLKKASSIVLKEKEKEIRDWLMVTNCKVEKRTFSITLQEPRHPIQMC